MLHVPGDLSHQQQIPTVSPDLDTSAVVGALPTYEVGLSWDASGGDAEAAFNRQAELPGVLVTKDGALVGLLCRARFMELMTHPFAPELYLRWPLSRLPKDIWPEPLIVAADLPIADAATRALARPAGQLYDPLVIRQIDGRLAVLGLQVLLLAEGRVLARYAASLETTLTELRLAQDNLVEARKMAALAGLVAGIAHEINTPVGLALTSGSHLRQQTAMLAEKLRAGTIKRSELDQYLVLAEEAGSHLETNLQRAAELIRSFKQVAIDQTSQERRSFDLRQYIEAVLFSLGPRLKKLPHRVEIDCPADLKMDSYPGAVAQVLSNLILNAVIHAFPQQQAGHIRIAAHSDGALVTLSVSDDGVGIPPENLPRIFDPFFTTKRGDGGSGLGLHIVFNLATRTLGGEVRCDSTPGMGTTFQLRLPLEGPQP